MAEQLDDAARERARRSAGDSAAMEWWYRTYRKGDNRHSEGDHGDMGTSPSPGWENGVRALEDDGA